MGDVFLPYLKWWAAFLGAMLQSVVPFVPVDSEWSNRLHLILALTTALAVFGVPNKETPAPSREAVFTDDEHPYL